MHVIYFPAEKQARRRPVNREDFSVLSDIYLSNSLKICEEHRIQENNAEESAKCTQDGI